MELLLGVVEIVLSAIAYVILAIGLTIAAVLVASMGAISIILLIRWLVD